MGAPKADLVLDGMRFVDHAVGALRAAGCTPVLAVVRAATRSAADRTVVNPHPERGMRSSLAIAIDELGDTAAIAVLLTDLPGVTAESCQPVVTAWRPGRVAVAAYARTSAPGHPIVMSPAMWADAIALAGPDEGARAFLRAHPDLVDRVDAPGDPRDLDTPEDVERWRRR